MTDYIYLASSLPYLSYDSKLEINIKSFLEDCCTILNNKDVKFIKLSDKQVGSISLDEYFRINHPLLDYYRWEFALRNEFIKKLDKKVNLDGDKYLRIGGFATEVDDLADNYLKLNPLEAEQMLMKERFKKLDFISSGHFFDIVFITSYLVKMKILTIKKSWDVEFGRKNYNDICKTLEYK